MTPPYFFVLLFTSTLGSLLFGYHLGELNAPQDVITCQKKTIGSNLFHSLPQCIPMSTLEFGLIQSIFTLGGLLGALSAGPVSSSRGRLSTMRINSFFQITGPACAALAPSVPVFAIGRFLSGIGAGAALVAVPIYVSEIAPPDRRGFYGAFTQITTNGGIFLTQFLGLFLSHGSAWRWILAVAGLIAVLQLFALSFSQESPRWLMAKGRRDEARSVLASLRGANTDVNEEINDWNMADADDDEHHGLLSPSTPKPADYTFFNILLDPTYRPAIWAILLVMAAQQLTGINSIVMYGVKILAVLLPSSSALLNVLVSIANVVLTTGFAPLVDVWGRKRCLLLSVSGMGVSSLLLAIALKSDLTVLSAVCVLTFVASFALGLGPVPFMLASELVDARGVSATQSWALSGNWIATFLVAQFFPVVNEALGKGGAYFMFAALSVVFWIAIAVVVPETKDKRGMGEVWGYDKIVEHDD